MKKIVGIVAAASLVAGLAFADEPVANLAITDFTGNAQVQWGVDLDAGQTGFKNSEYMKFVINLFDAGTKTTSSDNDVWAELEMKAGNTGWWAHRIHQTDANVDFNADAVNGGVASTISFDITAAKLHFGDFYVGIQNGDTQTGEYKFTGAIRSAGNDNAKWLTNVGPSDYSQGIVAGFGNNNLGIDVDFRSNPVNAKNAKDEVTEWNQYTSDYAVALEAQLKDSNEWVEGLWVDLGGSLNLSKERYTSVALTAADANEAVKNKIQYTLNVKENGTTYSFAIDNAKTIGYSFNAGYKLKIDDKNWLKPAVGLTGTYQTASGDVDIPGYKKVPMSGSVNTNDLVAGVIFGWGDTADDNAGLYYFDTDATKQVTPGVSVVAKIPLASKVAGTIDGDSGSTTSYDKVKVLLTPAFFTKGELVENLTAAVYSEMAILRSDDKDTDGKDSVSYTNAKDKNDTFALALAGAVKYDIKADEITVTPQAGFRYVNTAYADNGINGYAPLSTNKFFDDLGKQKKADSGDRALLDVYDDGFFNLKAGVNVNGLINNTDFFAVYQSANLLNKIDYSVFKDAEGNNAKFYNIKAGTFNVGCKISF